MNKYLRLLFDREFRFSVLTARGLYKNMPDEKFIEKKFYLSLGTHLNLAPPRTFNEKMQWLKLHDRNPIYTNLVDKLAVREYIKEKIGEKYLIPILADPWGSPAEIDYDTLPNQFVLKCTHDSGGLLVIKDKAKMDKAKAEAFLNKRLKRNYFFGCREWPYKKVKPMIFAEKFLENPGSDSLYVYKIMCFNGTPKIFQVIQNDKTDHETIDYFDTSWSLLNIKQNFSNSPRPLEKPACMEEMLELAKKLSKGFAFLRTDFYEVAGQIFFSELTFYSDGGFAPFEPPEWDEILGSWIELPGSADTDADAPEDKAGEIEKAPAL